MPAARCFTPALVARHTQMIRQPQTAVSDGEVWEGGEQRPPKTRFAQPGEPHPWGSVGKRGVTPPALRAPSPVWLLPQGWEPPCQQEPGTKQPSEALPWRRQRSSIPHPTPAGGRPLPGVYRGGHRPGTAAGPRCPRPGHTRGRRARQALQHRSPAMLGKVGGGGGERGGGGCHRGSRRSPPEGTTPRSAPGWGAACARLPPPLHLPHGGAKQPPSVEKHRPPPPCTAPHRTRPPPPPARPAPPRNGRKATLPPPPTPRHKTPSSREGKRGERRRSR